MSLIWKVKDFCKEHYDEPTYKHVIRVADYAVNNPVCFLFSDQIQKAIHAAALLHDIIEDVTSTPKVHVEAIELLSQFFEVPWQMIQAREVLYLLTRRKDESYRSYILRIKNYSDDEVVRAIAQVVKIADIKDHLMQRGTLTESLKQRYLDVIPYLI